MADVRSAISVAVVPLALLAMGLFAVAFAIGDRARVLRRLGLWAILAGASWIVFPPLVVWLTRRWAPGADAAAAAALDEAVSGLLPTAIALVVVGAAALTGSFAVPAPARSATPSRPDARPEPGRTPRPVRRRDTLEQPAMPVATTTTTTAMPRSRPVEPTAEMPVTRPGVPPPVSPAASEAVDDGDSLWDYYSSGPPSR